MRRNNIPSSKLSGGTGSKRQKGIHGTRGGGSSDANREFAAEEQREYSALLRDFPRDETSDISSHSVDLFGSDSLIIREGEDDEDDADDDDEDDDNENGNKSAKKRPKPKAKSAIHNPRLVETAAGIRGGSERLKKKQIQETLKARKAAAAAAAKAKAAPSRNQIPEQEAPQSPPSPAPASAAVNRKEHHFGHDRQEFMPLSSSLFDKENPASVFKAPLEPEVPNQNYETEQQVIDAALQEAELIEAFKQNLVKISLYSTGTVLAPPESSSNGLTPWSAVEEREFVTLIQDICSGAQSIPAPEWESRNAPIKDPEDRVLRSEWLRANGQDDSELTDPLGSGASADGRNMFDIMMENEIENAGADADANSYAEAVKNPKFCLAPDYERIVRRMGRPRDSFHCWGCSAARMNSASISFKKYNEMATFFKQEYNRMDDAQLAFQLWVFFEYYIRMPANRIASRKGLLPIAPWYPVEIWGHLTEHMGEPSVWLGQTLKNLKEDASRTRKYGYYMLVKDGFGQTIRVVNPRQWKMHREMIATIRQLYSCDPSKMFMYNPNMTVNWTEGRGFVNSQRPFHQIDVPSFYAAQK